MVRIGPELLDPGALLSAFCADRSASGAVASFVGLCRADGIEALELQHYPGFTETIIEKRVATEREALDDVLVVHRVGRVHPGEAIVFVAVAARHRRAAFDGADRLMDWLKTRAPFWKREHGPAGARWIEPRPEDYDDANRWAFKEQP